MLIAFHLSLITYHLSLILSTDFFVNDFNPFGQGVNGLIHPEINAAEVVQIYGDFS